MSYYEHMGPPYNLGHCSVGTLNVTVRCNVWQIKDWPLKIEYARMGSWFFLNVPECVHMISNPGEVTTVDRIHFLQQLPKSLIDTEQIASAYPVTIFQMNTMSMGENGVLPHTGYGHYGVGKCVFLNDGTIEIQGDMSGCTPGTIIPTDHAFQHNSIQACSGDKRPLVGFFAFTLLLYVNEASTTPTVGVNVNRLTACGYNTNTVGLNTERAPLITALANSSSSGSGGSGSSGSGTSGSGTSGTGTGTGTGTGGTGTGTGGTGTGTGGTGTSGTGTTTTGDDDDDSEMEEESGNN